MNDINNLYIGLLSGTSMDAIDAGIFTFTSNTSTNVQDNNHAYNNICLDKYSHPIPLKFKKLCLTITETGNCNIDQIGELDNWAGNLFADAVINLLKNSNVARHNIIAIGSHGQTLRHSPNNKRPFTMQIGDPNIIAERTGITTVADFRRRDLAAGGQGAPLAPLFHQAAFSIPRNFIKKIRVIVNIGGIANISILQPGKPVIGFDTGPGNCLLDYWTNLHFNQEFDQDGKLAQLGKVNEPLLNNLLADNFFKLAYPKTTGREYFTANWLHKSISLAKAKDLPPLDVQATLLQFTAQTIADVITQCVSNNASNNDFEVYLCGGGANNTYLQAQLGKLLNINSQIDTTAALGFDPNWVEAGLFAWLAKEALGRRGNNSSGPKAISTSSITGAKHPVPLGAIYG